MDETTAPTPSPEVMTFTAAGVDASQVVQLTPTSQSGPATLTLFDKLLADAKREVAKPDFVVAVETRKGYILVFSGDLPQAQLEAWQNRCRKGPAGTAAYTEINNTLLWKILIANQCIGIKFGDDSDPKEAELIRNSKGQPVTFNDPEFLIALGTPDMPNEGVAAFIDHDAWLNAVGLAVLRGTGWTAEAKDDPLVS